MKTSDTEAETAAAPLESRPSNFIRDIILDDLKTNKYGGRVQTRFPPEPNGYLHIGHAKAICLDFGLADEFGGHTNLRFDDTNPEKEETEYVDSIMADVKWLGFNWDGLFYASDYFDQLYEWALKLIRDGKAYVDDLSAEEIRKYRGTLTEPGKDSPHRNRSVEENLDLFERMKAGEFPDGSRVLRAKIDMASPNLNMRDPVMYRILHAEHHRTGNKWCIYPMYDYAHGQSDSLEKVTHSMCTLEFEDHRPLYNWFIQQLGIFPSQQIEFDRLNLTHTLLSKRKLRQLVQEGRVRGWDDPRMPTLSGIRRRGYTPEAIRNFVASIGVSKTTGSIELAMLEHFVREDLNKRAARVMAVLRPLKVVIDNYPENQVEEMDAVNNPEDPAAGSRKVPFSRVLYIEQDDFREVPPPKYFRLSPGREVRLRYGYFVTCKSVVKNEKGEVANRSPAATIQRRYSLIAISLLLNIAAGKRSAKQLPIRPRRRAIALKRRWRRCREAAGGGGAGGDGLHQRFPGHVLLQQMRIDAGLGPAVTDDGPVRPCSPDGRPGRELDRVAVLGLVDRLPDSLRSEPGGHASFGANGHRQYAGSGDRQKHEQLKSRGLASRPYIRFARS